LAFLQIVFVREQPAPPKGFPGLLCRRNSEAHWLNLLSCIPWALRAAFRSSPPSSRTPAFDVEESLSATAGERRTSFSLSLDITSSASGPARRAHLPGCDVDAGRVCSARLAYRVQVDWRRVIARWRVLAHVPEAPFFATLESWKLGQSLSLIRDRVCTTLAALARAASISTVSRPTITLPFSTTSKPRVPQFFCGFRTGLFEGLVLRAEQTEHPIVDRAYYRTSPPFRFSRIVSAAPVAQQPAKPIKRLASVRNLTRLSMNMAHLSLRVTYRANRLSVSEPYQAIKSLTIASWRSSCKLLGTAILGPPSWEQRADPPSTRNHSPCPKGGVAACLRSSGRPVRDEPTISAGPWNPGRSAVSMETLARCLLRSTGLDRHRGETVPGKGKHRPVRSHAPAPDRTMS